MMEPNQTDPSLSTKTMSYVSQSHQLLQQSKSFPPQWSLEIHTKPTRLQIGQIIIIIIIITTLFKEDGT